MKFIKTNKEKIIELNLNINIEDNANIYLFKDNNLLLGYGIINQDIKNNILYIYIYEEYRGNGYGTKLFNYLYDELKNEGIKELLFIIEKDNTSFISIIDKYNALHLGTNNNLVKYVVPVL